MTARRKARELVLKGLYAYRIHERDIGALFDELAEGSSLAEKHLHFARHLLETIIKNLAFLDEEIARLAENWELERIALIDRIILRMAMAEIHFMPDIPEKVAINEAIDLAKKYSTEESSSFVNGILDAAISDSESSSK
jgi:N utilization substance protein B